MKRHCNRKKRRRSCEESWLRTWYSFELFINVLRTVVMQISIMTDRRRQMPVFLSRTLHWDPPVCKCFW